LDLKLNADRFTGDEFVKTYDKFRPTPPKEILLQALNYLNKSKASLVLDLGCGTGISTQVWNDFADKIIGVEPSKEMIAVASKKNSSSQVEFINGYSNEIPLPSNSLDVIACSQSFHWMEPKSTLKEIDRLLVKNGVLVIYDIIWPASVNLEYEKAYNELFINIDKATSKLDQTIAVKWNKGNHLENIVKSNHFKFTKEAYFHKTEDLSKEKLIGLAMSQGGLEALLKKGFSKKELGITKFKKTIQKMGKVPNEKIIYNYKAIYAIK
jgi:ubiquinone/menaquinone biosynthesis C-methylase UbiE